MECGDLLGAEALAAVARELGLSGSKEPSGSSLCASSKAVLAELLGSRSETWRITGARLLAAVDAQGPAAGAATALGWCARRPQQDGLAHMAIAVQALLPEQADVLAVLGEALRTSAAEALSALDSWRDLLLVVDQISRLVTLLMSRYSERQKLGDNHAAANDEEDEFLVLLMDRHYDPPMALHNRLQDVLESLMAGHLSDDVQLGRLVGNLAQSLHAAACSLSAPPPLPTDEQGAAAAALLQLRCPATAVATAEAAAAADGSVARIWFTDILDRAVAEALMARLFVSLPQSCTPTSTPDAWLQLEQWLSRTEELLSLAHPSTLGAYASAHDLLVSLVFRRMRQQHQQEHRGAGVFEAMNRIFKAVLPNLFLRSFMDSPTMVGQVAQQLGTMMPSFATAEQLLVYVSTSTSAVARCLRQPLTAELAGYLQSHMPEGLGDLLRRVLQWMLQENSGAMDQIKTRLAHALRGGQTLAAVIVSYAVNPALPDAPLDPALRSFQRLLDVWCMVDANATIPTLVPTLQWHLQNDLSASNQPAAALAFWLLILHLGGLQAGPLFSPAIALQLNQRVRMLVSALAVSEVQPLLDHEQVCRMVLGDDVAFADMAQVGVLDAVQRVLCHCLEQCTSPAPEAVMHALLEALRLIERSVSAVQASKAEDAGAELPACPACLTMRTASRCTGCGLILEDSACARGACPVSLANGKSIGTFVPGSYPDLLFVCQLCAAPMWSHAVDEGAAATAKHAAPRPLASAAAVQAAVQAFFVHDFPTRFRLGVTVEEYVAKYVNSLVDTAATANVSLTQLQRKLADLQPLLIALPSPEDLTEMLVVDAMKRLSRSRSPGSSFEAAIGDALAESLGPEVSRRVNGLLRDADWSALLSDAMDSIVASQQPQLPRIQLLVVSARNWAQFLNDSFTWSPPAVMAQLMELVRREHRNGSFLHRPPFTIRLMPEAPIKVKLRLLAPDETLPGPSEPGLCWGCDYSKEKLRKCICGKDFRPPSQSVYEPSVPSAGGETPSYTVDYGEQVTDGTIFIGARVGVVGSSIMDGRVVGFRSGAGRFVGSPTSKELHARVQFRNGVGGIIIETYPFDSLFFALQDVDYCEQ